LGALTGLPLARGVHPESGARGVPDGLLRLVAERVVPAGDQPARWTSSEEVLEAAAALEAHGARATASPRGLSARVPFLPAGASGTEGSALLQVRAEAHPELGNGAF